MFETVAKMLAAQLNIPQSKVTAESRIIEDLGADSLDVVELLMQLEDEMGKTIPDDEITNIKTVGEIVAVLEKI